jgi:hypothetical protein
LRPGYRVLPDALSGPEIGVALVKSLYAAYSKHRSLELERIWNGDFVRRTFPRGTFASTAAARHDQIGALWVALMANPVDAPSWSERLYAGLPASGAETSTAGTLLIRLFEAAERADARVSFEYIPWAPAHLRYRLRYVVRPAGGPDAFRFLHGRDAVELLTRAAAFLSSAASH